MNSKTQIINAEDAETVLIEIEKSLGLTFKNNELIHISNLGQLCDYVSEKMELDNVDDCTSQQSFYQIRNSISGILNVNPKSIHPNSKLSILIPRKNRRQFIKKLNEILGFDTNLLMISRPTFIFLSFSLVFSFILSFFYFVWGWISFGLFAVSLKIAYDFRKELKVKTVRELTEKITREHYLECRRNPNTVNKSEIEKLVINSFNHYIGGSENFTREAVFH